RIKEPRDPHRPPRPAGCPSRWRALALGQARSKRGPCMREAGTAVAEVVTGEAVVLEVPCARFPSRLLALALDLLIQVTLLLILFLIVWLAVSNEGAASATAGAITLTVTIAIIVGYPVLWETLTRGGSPGKFALGLRVVGDDGGPERFRQALVRGLAAVVE